MDFLYIKAAVIAGITLVALDALWLGVIARSWYRQQLGSLMRPQPQWFIAGCRYAFMIAGFMWFVYEPVQMTRSLAHAMQYGARFGAVLFGIYECTNYAIIAGWPAPFIIVNMLWGSIVYAVASAALFLLRNVL